jgi:putative transposase
MKRRRFSEEQIIAILKEAQAGVPVGELTRKHGIAEGTYYRWKAKLGGMEVSDTRRLRVLEQENQRLKTTLTEVMLDNKVLKDITSKNW